MSRCGRRIACALFLILVSPARACARAHRACGWPSPSHVTACFGSPRPQVHPGLEPAARQKAQPSQQSAAAHRGPGGLLCAAEPGPFFQRPGVPDRSAPPSEPLRPERVGEQVRDASSYVQTPSQCHSLRMLVPNPSPIAPCTSQDHEPRGHPAAASPDCSLRRAQSAGRGAVDPAGPLSRPGQARLAVRQPGRLCMLPSVTCWAQLSRHWPTSSIAPQGQRDCHACRPLAPVCTPGSAGARTGGGGPAPTPSAPSGASGMSSSPACRP